MSSSCSSRQRDSTIVVGKRAAHFLVSFPRGDSLPLHPEDLDRSDSNHVMVGACVVANPNTRHFSMGWANRTTLAFLVVPLFLDSEESALPNAALTSSEVTTVSASKTYKNAVVPSQSQMQGFFQGDTESPILMLNLLKFK